MKREWSNYAQGFGDSRLGVVTGRAPSSYEHQPEQNNHNHTNANQGNSQHDLPNHKLQWHHTNPFLFGEEKNMTKRCNIRSFDRRSK